MLKDARWRRTSIGVSVFNSNSVVLIFSSEPSSANCMYDDGVCGNHIEMIDIVDTLPFGWLVC